MKILKFLFCFIIIKSYSQKIISGKIIYQYDIQNISKDENKKNQYVIDKFLKTLQESKSKISYVLSFNENESFYELEENLDLDNDKSLQYAKLLTGGKEKIYSNIRENLLLKEVDFLGDNFIVKGKISKDWLLTQETRLIGTYWCFKAILKNKTSKSRLKIPEIIAWYSPNIPLSFGPKGFGNLPGLLLELKIGPITYRATKIEISPSKKIKIIKPSKGVIVTEKEFNDILQGLDKRQMKN